MNQPLGAAVGNALEVMEAVEVLRGGGPAEVRDLTLDLGVRMLIACGAEQTDDSARTRLTAALDSGSAWRVFASLVEAQGGDARLLDRSDGLPRAPIVRPLLAAQGGSVTAFDTFALGELAVAIGAG